MYHPKVTAQKLENYCDLTNAARKKAGKPDDFALCYHSIEQVETADRFLTGVSNFHDRDRSFTGWKRELTPEELHWIQNERALCRFDFTYWATRYAWIKTFEGEVKRFAPNLAQRIFLDMCAEQEERGVEILLAFLKARRLGISTINELHAEWRVQFYPNVTCVIGSDTPENTDKMSKMLTFSMDRQPHWLRPRQTRFKTGLFYEFENNSRISLEHGTQFGDIGRGYDPSVFHLSELAKYDNPESSIDAGLMRAVIPHPMVFGVLEGTPDGDTGWWFDKYQQAKTGYARNRSRFKTEFLPWFTGVEIYPSPAFLRRSPVPADYTPEPETRSHARKALECVRAHPLLRKHLGEDWVMPAEQQWFYETNIEEYRELRITHKWYQEMAGDDIEAWQSKEVSVFDAELLAEYRNSCALPAAVYGIRGGFVTADLEPAPSEIDPTRPVVRVTADWAQQLKPLDFEFVPLKFNGFSDFSPVGKLIIWEQPKDDEIYEFSADVADGLGAERSDNTVITVMRKGDRDRLPAQVAEFATPDISGAALWPWGLAIGTYFAVRRDGKRRQPRLVPEVNREGGKDFIKKMLLWGWKNFYLRKELTSTKRGRAALEYGWLMDHTNRSEMLQDLIREINRKKVEINSPWLVSEMGTFIKDDTGKLIAAKGKKDDRLIALGICYASMYAYDPRSPGRTQDVERDREPSMEEMYPPWTPGDIARPVMARGVDRLLRSPGRLI